MLSFSFTVSPGSPPTRTNSHRRSLFPQSSPENVVASSAAKRLALTSSSTPYTTAFHWTLGMTRHISLRLSPVVHWTCPAASRSLAQLHLTISLLSLRHACISFRLPFFISIFLWFCSTLFSRFATQRR